MFRKALTMTILISLLLIGLILITIATIINIYITISIVSIAYLLSKIHLLLTIPGLFISIFIFTIIAHILEKTLPKDTEHDLLVFDTIISGLPKLLIHYGVPVLIKIATKLDLDKTNEKVEEKTKEIIRHHKRN